MRFTCMLTVQLPRRGGEGFGKYSVAVLLSCGFSTELYQEVQVCFTVSACRCGLMKILCIPSRCSKRGPTPHFVFIWFELFQGFHL